MNAKKIEPLLPLLPFLVTASELRDRKTKRRRKPNHSEAIRRLIELGLKVKRSADGRPIERGGV